MYKKLKKESLSDLKDITENVEEETLELGKKTSSAAKEVVEKIDETASGIRKNKKMKAIFQKSSFKKLAFTVLIIVALGSTTTSYYFYNKFTNAQVLGEQDQANAVKAVVDKVSKLMDLPAELPTVASVSDIEKLSSQPFFKRAQNGDKLLIYQTTKKAILYRPSTNKIIDVATVNLGEKEQQKVSLTVTPTTAEVKEPVSIIILNGTTTTGLTNEAEKLISGIKNLDIKDKDNAKNRNYVKNLVVNAKGVDQSQIDELADKLDAEIGKLPEGEEKSEADVIIILGSEFADSISEAE